MNGYGVFLDKSVYGDSCSVSEWAECLVSSMRIRYSNAISYAYIDVVFRTRICSPQISKLVLARDSASAERSETKKNPILLTCKSFH